MDTALEHNQQGSHSEHAGNDPSSTTKNLHEAAQDLDWVELEERYHQAMEDCARAEQNIHQEFNEWIKVLRTKLSDRGMS